jgi:hypothetical protein
MPSKVDFDDFSGSYNELLRERTDFFTEDELYFARYKVALARELVTTEPRRVLEYGCGIGRNILSSNERSATRKCSVRTYRRQASDCEQGQSGCKVLGGR